MERYVLTGAPGCGKTSLMLELETRGFPVIREAAEDVIRLQQAKGIKHPWELDNFQDKILRLQQMRYYFAPKQDVFIDRGYRDGLAYTNRFDGVNWWIHQAAKNEGIDHVYFIDLLPQTEQNEIRKEKREQALKLHDKLIQVYEESRVPMTRIPCSSVEERANLVLASIGA